MIVGLGNPGKEYAGTRHNVGWDTAALAATQAKFVNKPEFKAEIAEQNPLALPLRKGETSQKVLFVHPLTFMNLSGEAVKAIKKYFKIKITDILVVQDEMDLPEGQLRFSQQAGAAGHKGVTSIIESLASNDFARLRIGIGHPPEKIEAQDYVLGKRGKNFDIRPAVEAIKDWLELGTTAAMNQWNQK